METNPYQSPGVGDAETPDDDTRLLTAMFDVDRTAACRALRSHVEQRITFRGCSFVLSLVLLIAVLSTILGGRLHFWALWACGAFIVHQVSMLLLPYFWTRGWIARCTRTGEWPAPPGFYRVDLGVTYLSARINGDTRHWLLRDIPSAFYLGDLLLVRPEPGTLIPVPRGADFGTDTFTTFCSMFAVRYRPARMAALGIKE